MTSTGQNPDLGRAREMADRVNAAGGTYHRLELAPGVVLDGDYDMDRYVGHYRVPERLDGQTFLDVGTSSGYFALEAHKRGAKVSAIDLWPEDCLLAEISDKMGLGIEYHRKNIYDLDESFGTFDFVMCGSLLLHLPDQFGAIRALRSVTGKRLVVSTATTVDSATNVEPLCNFIGKRADDGDYWAYWEVSAAALRAMLLAAGFSRVDNIEHFSLDTEAHRVQYSVRHVVMSAYV
ncbi:class I SAM-dependent methyltransferase [Actinokineospora soli]|uniref:Class I SAM-dependent methyltransferase n=1 Tax=Actinokineospora soli TaxID=1048753 RepID=A0ABW2U0J6_9PSEU